MENAECKKRTSIKRLGEESSISDRETFKMFMKEHAEGLLVVGDTVTDFEMYTLEGRKVAMRYDIYSPFFPLEQKLFLLYDIVDGSVIGYREGMSDDELEDLQLCSVKGNFILGEEEGFIGSTIALVMNYVHRLPFVVESDSERIITTFRDNVKGALEYKKASAKDKSEESKWSRTIRKFNDSSIELLVRRITCRFVTRSEKLYVDFEFLTRGSSRILYGIRVSTSKSSYGSDTFSIRCVNDIDDFAKYIMLDESRYGRYRQQSVYYSDIVRLSDFLYQRWIHGSKKNEFGAFGEEYFEVR